MINTLLEFLQSLFSVSPHTAVWFEIGIIIVIAAFFALLAGALKQPLIPAYILAGLIIGPIGLGIIKNTALITSLSEIGIAFLLFIAGLHIDIRKLGDVKKAALSVGIIQVLLVFSISFVIAILIGFYRVEAIYIGLILAFSSTVIVVKLLIDKGELDTLHGKMILGILLLQDIVAILAIAILSSGKFSALAILATMFKGVLIAAIAVSFSRIALNKLFKFAASSFELLFLIAIAYCFFFSLISYLAGFSIIVGAFIAGIALASSPFKAEIESRVRPLRDFFVILFFVALGMQLVLKGLRQFALLFFFFIAVAVILKPLIIMLYVRLFGYKKRTSFLSGLSLAQTSEFSLIIASSGLLLGHISQGLFSVTVLVTVITMTLATYFIKYDVNLHKIFSRPLDLLEKLPEKEKLEYVSKKKKDIALFGCHRMGTIFLKAFSHVIHRVVVIDINPNVIRSLMKKRISCIYGDLINPVILDKINLKKLKLVVSTVPEKLDNLFLIENVKEANPDALVFVTADYISEAMELYKKGADYVILPQVLGGERGLSFLKRIVKEKKQIIKAKEEHIRYLEDLRSFI